MSDDETKPQSAAEAAAHPEPERGERDDLDKAAEEQGVVVPRRRARREQADESNPWIRRGLVIGLGTAAAAIAGLVLVGMQDGAVYSKPVDQLIANKAKFAGRPVRVEGMLVHGSLEKRDKPCEYRFTIEKNNVRLPVRYAQCVVPDTFQDRAGMDVGVTVEGELHADNTFEATSVLAKCPSKYEMRERQQRGEQAPHPSMETAPTL